MLSALSHYLQHLPLPSQDSTRAATEAATATATSSESQDPALGSYAPSTRAVLVSAVAADFNVRALRAADIGAMQNKLMQFGLTSGRELDAFAALNTARADLTDDQTVDAVAVVDSLVASVDERQASYSERQQLSRLQTLLHNLDSARQMH